jgi:hypothetical protein
VPRIAFAGLAVVVASLIVISAGMAQTATPTETAARDEAEFVRLRDEALQRPLVYGPADGNLAMEEQRISLATADLSVRDFAVHVTFTNPAPAAEHPWDYGVVFRLTDQRAYQLGVHSTDGWFLAVDTAPPDQTGSLTTLNLSAGGTNSLDLIAIGERGYFGVNGSYVATLDLSANTEAGQVAVAAPFFSDSYIAGGSTPYEDFIVWSFDEGAATPVASDGSPLPVATVETGATPTTNGAGYTSPTYGYTLTWDDEWHEVTRSSQDGYDFLRIASDTALADFAGFRWTASADDCIDGLVSYYQGQPGYSDVRIAVDDAGNERRGHDGATAWAIVEFTLTADGQTDAYVDYVACRPLVAGESMLSIEYLTFADDFDAQDPARERLLTGLTLPGTGGDTGAPVAATATPGSALGPVGLTLNEQNGSGVGGLATLAETDDGGETVVKVLIVGALPGAVALIHAGTCADLDPAPAFLLRPIDAYGASETTIDATLRDLRVMGEYAIVIHASVDDLSSPVACGEIPTVG